MMTTDDITDLTPELHDEAESELARLRATGVGRRITALEVLLDQTAAPLNGGVPVYSEPRPVPNPPTRRGPGVSEAILSNVRQYLENKGEVRQREVTRDLELNSGSASLALRHLEALGDVTDTGRVVNKSKVWRFTGTPERVAGEEPARRATDR